MVTRGMQVNDPKSVVLIDNVSNGIICLPREGKKDIIFKPGQTAQISWAEFIEYKSTPLFGRFIELNDSVVIADGMVKIKNVSTDLNDDIMIHALVQDEDRVKEFVLTLNEGERELFSNFLTIRETMGIEQEKCLKILEFMGAEFAEKVEKTVPVEAKAEEPPKRKRGRPRKTKPVVVENEEALTAHVERVEDSE